MDWIVHRVAKSRTRLRDFHFHHFLLQGIFLTQGLILHHLHWQECSLPLYHLGNPRWRAQALFQGIDPAAYSDEHFQSKQLYNWKLSSYLKNYGFKKRKLSFEAKSSEIKSQKKWDQILRKRCISLSPKCLHFLCRFWYQLSFSQFYPSNVRFQIPGCAYYE